MDQTQLYTFASVIGVSGVVMLSAYFLLLRINKGSVLYALHPYFQQAIWIAEKTAADELATGEKVLSGADKKAIADSLYSAIPVNIRFFRWSIPVWVVKRFVTEQDWEAGIQRVFDEGSLLADTMRTWLLKQLPAPTVSAQLAAQTAALIAPPVLPVVSQPVPAFIKDASFPQQAVPGTFSATQTGVGFPGIGTVIAAPKSDNTTGVGTTNAAPETGG